MGNRTQVNGKLLLKHDPSSEVRKRTEKCGILQVTIPG